MLSAPSPLRARDLRRAALLLAATALAYLPALRGGPIVDDAEHLTAPGLRSAAGLWRIWTAVGATHQYYPLLHSAFWLEHRLWGDAPLGYHLLNVLLHGLCAGLLVLLLRRLAVPGAWLAGFLFALHPVNVESVAWIAEQKNTLSLFFCLLAALAWLRWDGRRGRAGYALATGLFALALLSKTAAAALPLALLVLVWWRRRRIAWRGDLLPLLPWFLLGAAASVPTAWLERQFCARFPGDFRLSAGERILVAGRAFWFYLGKLAWPHPLVFVYPRWNPAGWGASAWIFPLAAAALLAALALLARRRRGPLAAALIFLAALLPVLGFASFFWQALSYVGDHLQYLAAPAVFALAGAGWAAWAARCPRLATACAWAVVAALGLLTWRRSGLYRDPERLYRATLARNPSAWAIHYELGDVLANQPGRTDEAVAEWERAVSLKPDYADAQSNLGCVLAGMPGRGAEAVAHFEAALRARPNFAEAHANLGCVLAGLPGRADEAAAHLRAALRLQPDYPEAENALGNLLVDRPGQLDAGIEHLRAAVRLRPDFAEAHWDLGLALAREPARRSEAAAEIEAALRLDPGIPGAAEALARLRAQRG
ncbi:MAG TPA: tetratricopeptide repeat protein [Opitutaceae bacterium]|nr:tetratricopeptide repeat protein [Opitutaceae bacterium]